MTQYIYTPEMTSNSAPSPFVATRSSVWFAGAEAFYAFTGRFSGSGAYWSSNATTGWIALDLGAAFDIVGYVIQPTNPITRAPRDFTFQGSNDGSSWTTLDTQTSVTAWTISTCKYFSLSPVSYRHYKLDITANNGATDYVQIGQLGFLIDPAAGGSSEHSYAHIG